MENNVVENNAIQNNTLPRKKGNKSLVIILIIIILGLVGYLVYDKVIVKDTDNQQTNNGNNNENGKVKFESKYVDFGNIANNENKTYTASTNINDKNIEFKLEIKDDALEENVKSETLYMDGKTLLQINSSNENHSTLQFTNRIYMLNDIVIVKVNVQAQANPAIFYVFDKDGNQIKTFGPTIDNMEFANGSPTNHQIKNDSNYKNYFTTNGYIGFTINENKIKFLSVYSFLASACASAPFAVTESPDTVWVREYEVEYLGNSKLSDVKVVKNSDVKLKDFQTKYCTE